MGQRLQVATFENDITGLKVTYRAPEEVETLGAAGQADEALSGKEPLGPYRALG